MRRLALALAFSPLLALLPQHASAVSTTGVTVNNVSIFPGESVILTLSMDSNGPPKVWALTFHVFLPGETSGDGCVPKSRLMSPTIEPGQSFTLTFPDDFAETNSGGCNTYVPGIYHSLMEIATRTESRTIVRDFSVDFMVIPESPIGIIALMGSSLAVLGGFVYFKHYRNRVNI